MNTPPWRLSARELARRIAAGGLSASKVTHSVLDRIDAANPSVNALVDVMREEALAAAAAADRQQAAGLALGPLHGVPVSIKVNVDTAGRPTTDGTVAGQQAMATKDSPLVRALREAGAVVIGRSNTPAFSLRWFTDNEAHGRTLNPFDAGRTPGGSSGGAAVAVALGMGPIAHGNDYGGSIRYPAWACGVVGLRTTVGRVPSYKASGPNRILSNQQMSVQGPLTRHVDDARLALQIMARASPLDPQWVPAPLVHEDIGAPLRVAVMRQHPAYDADPSVQCAVDQAAHWLEAAGVEVVQAEPPHFEEAAELWQALVFNDLRRGGQAAIAQLGDRAVQNALSSYLATTPLWDRDALLDALTRRFGIARDWAEFFERHPVLLMPNSWERPFRVDEDQRGPERMRAMLRAQSPQLSTAMLGLPALSVPTGLDQGLPTGVQLVAGRFREDRLLRVGELIENAARFSALDTLLAPGPA